MHKYRTHNCSELRTTDQDTIVKLSGWVHRKRDHGNLLFIDIRDNYGITQCVIQKTSKYFKILEKIKPDSVISIVGKVLKRTPETINKEIPTGDWFEDHVIIMGLSDENTNQLKNKLKNELIKGNK